MIKMPKVLVVGASVTGGGVYHYLSSIMPQIPKECFTFWEKSSIGSFGGRMCKASYGDSFCDMGAQYITKSCSAELESVYSSLVSSGTFHKLDITIDGMKPEHVIKTHYISPKGLSSIVDHLLSGIETRSQVLFDTTLDDLNILSSGQIMATGSRKSSSSQSIRTSTSDQLAIATSSEQLKETFDVIVLTIPTPFISQIKGNYISTLTTIDGINNNKIVPVSSLSTFIQQLEQVKYSSRYALAVFYPINSDTQATLAALGSNINSSPSATTNDNSNGNSNNKPWGAKYVFDNDVIRYISFEGRKSLQSCSNDDNAHANTMPILVHTSVPFGIEHANTDPSIVEKNILDNLLLVLPTLKDIAAVGPVHTELLFWKESQVSKGLNWNNGQGSAVFPTTITATTSSDSGNAGSGTTGIIFAGDYFTESNFEGCLKSSHSAAVSVSQLLSPL